MTIEEIQRAIAELSPNERTRLRLWLAEYDALSEPQTSANTVEKLGRMAGRAFADFRKRMREP